VRTTTLRAVLAPAEDQQVVLEPLAVVHGAIGFPRGERCPIYDVRLATAVAGKASADNGDDDDDAPSMSPGPDCRFELAVPEGVQAATVVARGNGWFLEQEVAIPARGDPDSLCLNPPCRDDPTEGLAALRVSLEGHDASRVDVEVTYGDDESGGRMSSCASSRGGCRLDKLPVGEPLTVQASSDGCRGETRTVTLGSGETSLSLPCTGLRRVEGVVRISDGALPDAVTVRCAGGGSHALHHSRLFVLTCATDDTDLEVQIGRGGPWQVVAIPVTGDPAFVEIGL